jgi:non-canonical poly(A) RNA polymerase PAPD5/7
MTRKNQRNNDNMSRQPPLPSGLPPGSGRGYANSDSYRPHEENYYRQEPEQMYQFRGAAHNSYRPSYDQPSYDQRSRLHYDSYAPGISSSRGSATDSYRDRAPPNEFNFRYDAPPSMDYQAPSRYRSPPRQRTNHQDNNGSFRQNNNANHNRSATRGGYRGRAGPRMAADREFLKGNRAPTPELMPGMDDDQGNPIKYVPMDDVSDSGEAEMDLSDDEGVEPKQKQARTGAQAPDGDSIPKWSNPDPYTALPPPDESRRKKKDVVKLIRKARVASSSENMTKSEAVADDFISFDFDDDDQAQASAMAQQPGNGIEGAPTGPRFSHRDNTHKQEQQGSLNQFRENHQIHSANQIANVSSQEQLPATQSLNEKLPQHQLPTKPATVVDLTPNPDLGNRKRTIRDEIKGPLQAPPMIHPPSTGKGKPRASGRILKEWDVIRGVSPTPWLSVDHSDSINMGLW